MNEYIFENLLNSNIKIRIKAYTAFGANQLLSEVVSFSEDYKLIK